jgi:hypothetical protein
MYTLRHHVDTEAFSKVCGGTQQEQFDLILPSGLIGSDIHAASRG